MNQMYEFLAEEGNSNSCLMSKKKRIDILEQLGL